MSVELDACTDVAIGHRIAALFDATGYRLSISQLSRKENGKEGHYPMRYRRDRGPRP